MTLFRPQRGTLAEAMAEVREFDGTRAGLQALLPRDYTLYAVEPYGFDHRIGWDTYIVSATCPGSRTDPAAVGFTNGPVVA